MTRSRQSTLIVCGSLAGLLFLIVVAGSQFSLGKDSRLTCVVEDTRTGGGAGLQDWASRMGIKTIPLRAPLWEVSDEVGDELGDRGNCLLTAGDRKWLQHESEFPQEHWNKIHHWIASGNTLIVVTNSSGSLPDQLANEFTQPASINHLVEFRKEHHKADFSGKSEQLVPTWWGGKMEITGTPDSLVNYPSELHLAGFSGRTILAKRPLGKGHLYLLLDGSVWANQGLDRADNAATLARILNETLSEHGVLAIDEYRHGYGRVESFASFLIALPGAAPLLWMSLIWGLFWMIGRMKRLCPVEPFIEEPRRTAFEFIESLAALNQRARAAPLVVNAVSQRIRYLLHQRGQLTEENLEQLDGAIQSVASAPRPAVPQRQIQTVTELIQLRRSTYGIRPGSRAD